MSSKLTKFSNVCDIQAYCRQIVHRRLTKAQIDFMGMQPQKLSQQLVKKPAGIFHRQMQSSGDRSGGGRPTQRGDASGINRLDARNDKAVNTHGAFLDEAEVGRT